MTGERDTGGLGTVGGRPVATLAGMRFEVALPVQGFIIRAAAEAAFHDRFEAVINGQVVASGRTPQDAADSAAAALLSRGDGERVTL